MVARGEEICSLVVGHVNWWSPKSHECAAVAPHKSCDKDIEVSSAYLIWFGVSREGQLQNELLSSIKLELEYEDRSYNGLTLAERRGCSDFCRP